MHSRIQPGARAFTLIELLVVISIVSLLVGLLIPALRHSRQSARLAVCESNMRQLVTAQVSYGLECKDRIAALNWVPGQAYSTYPDLVSAADDGFTLTQGKQVSDIVRRRTGRNQPLVQGRSFNRNFWHLVLADGGYFGDSANVVVPGAACPDDEWVKLWQKNETNFAALMGSEGAGGSEQSYVWYRPYWCTYQLAPVAWSSDRRRGWYDPITQDQSNPHLYIVPPPGAPCGQRRFDEVSFASQKVFFHDVFDRHSRSRPIWFAYQVARQPLAFFDGSVRYCRTGDAQIGWDPMDPDSSTHITYDYNPDMEFPGYNWPTLSGNPIDRVDGYFRWTRGGLRGIDYITDRVK